MTVYANIAYNRSAWVKVPAGYFPEAPDAPTWGNEMSLACWKDSGRGYKPEQVDHLAAVLTHFAATLGPGTTHAEHESDRFMEIQTLLHLRDPQQTPFPVRVMVLHEALVRTEKITIQGLVQVEDPEAIDTPDVVDFDHPHLGRGLRAFRHRTAVGGDASSDGVFAVLRYAFPVPDHDDLVLVTLSWPDLARIAAAREDIDALVRSISSEYHPDATAANHP